jgi:hypothetical protein
MRDISFVVFLPTCPTIKDPVHVVRIELRTLTHTISLAGTLWQRVLIWLLNKTINWKEIEGNGSQS